MKYTLFWISLLVLVFLSFALPSSTNVTKYINVSEAEVQDGFGNEILEMRISRIIKRNYQGSYSVALWHDGQRVCDTGRIDVPYFTSDPLPNPVTIQWWAYGGSCFIGSMEEPENGDGLLASTLDPGFYTIETCHGVRRFFGVLPPTWHCWTPSHFEIWSS